MRRSFRPMESTCDRYAGPVGSQRSENYAKTSTRAPWARGGRNGESGDQSHLSGGKTKGNLLDPVKLAAEVRFISRYLVKWIDPIHGAERWPFAQSISYNIFGVCSAKFAEILRGDHDSLDLDAHAAVFDHQYSRRLPPLMKVENFAGCSFKPKQLLPV